MSTSRQAGQARADAVKYRTILADPPWPVESLGTFKVPRHQSADVLPYALMSLDEIKAMPVSDLAEDGAHLWLWTTNGFLRAAFDVMEAWGAHYLNTVTWVKPSGFGAYFANTTQHLLMGYFGHCRFNGARWTPTHFMASPPTHSRKPDCSYDLIESISEGPRLELFARLYRFGWAVWGNETYNSSPIGVTP